MRSREAGAEVGGGEFRPVLRAFGDRGRRDGVGCGGRGGGPACAVRRRRRGGRSHRAGGACREARALPRRRPFPPPARGRRRTPWRFVPRPTEAWPRPGLSAMISLSLCWPHLEPDFLGDGRPVERAFEIADDACAGPVDREAPCGSGHVCAPVLCGGNAGSHGRGPRRVDAGQAVRGRGRRRCP